MKILSKPFQKLLIMKKILFIILLLPLTAMAQKGYSRCDSLSAHICGIQDTSTVCEHTLNITSLINEGWIYIEWLNKIGATIYPNIRDMHRWDSECEQIFMGTSISY
jgi:hypothetical protein